MEAKQTPLIDLRAALAQQVEPTVTEDMKSAVRWAPSSAYWSQRLREFFGPEAREGIDALERRLAKAQQAEPVQDQRCRAEPRSDGDFVCDCKIGECPGRSVEPAQEPVAWRWGYRSVTTGEMDWRGYVEIAAHPNLRSPEIIIEPLYTAPPQRKQAEPAQEPITRLFGTLPVHDTQQALAQQAEPVEPVVRVVVKSITPGSIDELHVLWPLPRGEHLLYTAPPQRQPLPLKTVEKLIYENTKISPNVADDRELLGYIVNAVRAVERAHGIKE